VLLKHAGIEPISQFTCRDRNRIALQYDLVILKSPQMGKFMNGHVSGIKAPQALIGEMTSVPAED
jgi:hypothetical protein